MSSDEGDDDGDEFNTGGAADSPPIWRPRSKGEIFSGRSFENLENSATDDTQQQRRRRHLEVQIDILARLLYFLKNLIADQRYLDIDNRVHRGCTQNFDHSGLAHGAIF